MSLLILPRRFKETHIDLIDRVGLDYRISLSGKYKVQVCRNGHVIREPFGPKMLPNLITNGMFDYLMGTGSAQSQIQNTAISWAHTGTGTTTPANTDVKLTTETQNTNTLFTGGGMGMTNDTTLGAFTATQVFEFPAVGSGVTLNEIGLFNTSLTTSGCMTHALFPTGVTLSTGDNLRLTYSFTYSIPSLVTPITVSLAAVNGFNVSGTMKVCGTYANIFGTISSGAGWSFTTNYVCENLFQGNVAGTGNSPPLQTNTSFPAVNTNLTEAVISGSLGSHVTGSYTNGTFTRSVTSTWTPSQPTTTVSNVNMIRLIGSSSSPGVGLYLLLTSAQTKANTNTLTLTWGITMARG